jgi:hypothetical protein
MWLEYFWFVAAVSNYWRASDSDLVTVVIEVTTRSAEKGKSSDALTQAVRRWLLVTKPRVRFWVTSRIIREAGSGDGTGFTQTFSGFLLHEASGTQRHCLMPVSWWFLPSLTLQT